MTAPRDRQELARLMAHALEAKLMAADIEDINAVADEDVDDMHTVLDALEAHCTVCPNEPVEEMLSTDTVIRSNERHYYAAMLVRAPYRREK